MVLFMPKLEDASIIIRGIPLIADAVGHYKADYIGLQALSIIARNDPLP